MTVLAAEVVAAGFGRLDLDDASDRAALSNVAGFVVAALRGDLGPAEIVRGLRESDARPSRAQAAAFVRAVAREHVPELFARDRLRFPRALLYAGRPGSRRVAAEAVLVGYAQLRILECLIEGRSRVEASRVSWGRFYDVLVPLTLGAVAGGSSAAASARVPRSNCMAASAGWVAGTLRAEWPQVLADSSNAWPGGPPSTMLTAGDADLGCWLADAVRRVSDGVPVLLAARQAHDLALGRPRQNRSPVEEGWLSERIGAAAGGLWLALLNARMSTADGGLLWVRVSGESEVG